MAHPVALALSGGGDSMALLDLTAEWARSRGRRLLTLTVDHGLNPQSAQWSCGAEATARTAGADWKGLVWTADKPSTGVSAAARKARHALIAEAARAAGARVVLFAHTADDLAEAALMRDEGSSVGDPREWAPSPAWPEGRGLMLMRPLLAERRGALRDWLRKRGLDWIEDPANDDPRSGRARARAALAGGGEDADRLTAVPHPPARASSGPLPLPSAEGSFVAERAIAAPVLRAVLVCAGGGSRPPVRDRLAALRHRLVAGEDFIATLAGARLEAAGDRVLITREAGEFGRRSIPPLATPRGAPVVWDGRFELMAREEDWRVAPARGRLARLSPQDRAVVGRLPAAVRGALPVLIRDDGAGPVLAWRRAEVRALGPRRLWLALDQTTREADLGRMVDGETPSPDLFS